MYANDIDFLNFKTFRWCTVSCFDLRPRFRVRSPMRFVYVHAQCASLKRIFPSIRVFDKRFGLSNRVVVIIHVYQRGDSSYRTLGGAVAATGTGCLRDTSSAD